MSLWQAIVLGIVQGLTEFLPISSSAHLRIVPALLGWGDPRSAFSAVIQCGTVAAVLVYFASDLWRIGRGWLAELVRGTFWRSSEGRLGWMIIAGTFPIVACGLLFEDLVDNQARELGVIALAMVVLALLLMLAERRVQASQLKGNPGTQLDEVTWRDALVIGVVQTLALVPGSSRSGVTIMAGLFRGLNRETAARFSFLLSVPAVAGAGFYKLYKQRGELFVSEAQTVNLLAATLVSFVVGYLSIAFLLDYLKKHSTYLFIFYRLLLGGILLGLLLGLRYRHAIVG